jgi:hypothetical protein
MCRSNRTFQTQSEERDRDVRASDADRERAADHLRQQAGEGRLDTDELEKRLEAAFAARTLADLDGLTADLPRRRDERPRRPAAVPTHALLLAAVITLAIVVHPLIWLALIPVMCLKHAGPTGPAAWRGSPS